MVQTETRGITRPSTLTFRRKFWNIRNNIYPQ